VHKVAIIQARMGSTRFPNKIVADICGKTMLERVIEKLSASKKIDQIVVATTNSISDLPIIQYCKDHQIHCFAGSEEDVLARYYEAAKKFSAEVVIRVTSDCPLFDAGVLDEGLNEFISGDYDYVTNILPPSYPDGLDYSIIRFKLLEDAFQEAKLSSEREHVVPWIWKQCPLQGGKRYRALNMSMRGNFSEMRWTVDYPQDLDLVKRVYAHFANRSFNWVETSQFMFSHPEIFKINQSIIRDEGYFKSVANDREVKK